MKLTDRIISPSGFTTNQTYFHVVDTNNPTQDPAGSSYKSTIDGAISGSPFVVIISGTGLNTSVRRGVNNVATGDNSGALGGYNNQALSNNSMVVGGYNNIISGGTHSFIGGGSCNTSSGYNTIIGGGCNNRICFSGDCSTIGGGSSNLICSCACHATIGGGRNNCTNNPCSTIGGGCNNRICCSPGGQSSTIGGGVNNRICGAGYRSTISGGKCNTSCGSYNFIGGGGDNFTTGQGAIVVGGQNNCSCSAHAVIVGGRCNCILGACCSFIGGGRCNIICGTGSGDRFRQVIVGGVCNTTSNRYSTIVGGGYGIADRFGQRSFSIGTWSGFTGSTCQGHSQHIELLGRNVTTGSSPVNIFLNEVNARITVPNERVLFVTVNIAGIKDDGSSAAHYIRKVAIKNVGGTTSLIGTVSIIGTDVEDNVNYDVTITADDTNDALDIQVTGDVGENMRWTIHINGIEMKYSWS